jgi:recombination protein RecA
VSDKAKEMQDLQKALKAIQKDFGKGSAILLGDNNTIDCEFIPIDSLKLSRIMGGGIPKGKIIEIFGPESSGKTTISNYLIGQAQKAGFNCAFIDAEHAYTPQYAKKVGVDINNLIFTQPDSGEQALEICEKMIDEIPNLGVIVIDSVAALTPQAEIDGEMGDSHMGLQARLLSQAMRKLTAKLGKNKVTLIAINQTRQKIGVLYGNPETTPGGNALKFYASIRLTSRKKEEIVDGSNLKGIRINVKAIKNKVATPMRNDILDLYFATGFDVMGEVIDFAVHYGLIEKGGAWFNIPNVEEKFQGKRKVIKYYNEHKKELFDLREQVLQRINTNVEEIDEDGNTDSE